MAMQRARRAAFFAIVAFATIAIVCTWLDYVAPVDTANPKFDASTFLSVVVGSTGTIGAIALALVFVTAQLSPDKGYLIRRLHRSDELYAFLALFVITVLLGYVLLAHPLSTVAPPLSTELAGTFLILALTSV